MPKKALVLNGFGGGINKDSDTTDLPAEGRGKDQVVTMQNMLADLGGKTYVSNYKFVAETTIVDTRSISGTDGLLIFDDKWYQETGLYKIGGDVNWSGNITANTPTAIAHSSSQGASIAINPTFTTSELDSIFLGGGASLASTSNAKFGNVEVTGNYKISDFIRPVIDWDQDDNWGDGQTGSANDTVLDFTTLGGFGDWPNITEMNHTLTNPADIDLWTHDGTTVQASPSLVVDASNGLKILDGCENDFDAPGNSKYRMYSDSSTMASHHIYSYTDYNVRFNIAGMSAGDSCKVGVYYGAEDDDLTPGTDDPTTTLTELGSTTVSADGDHEFTMSNGLTTYPNRRLYIVIGQGAAVVASPTGNGFFYMGGLQIFTYGNDYPFSSSHSSHVKVSAKNSSDQAIDTYTGDDIQSFTNPFTRVNYNMAGTSHLTLSKKLNNNDHPAMIFRTGTHTFNGSDLAGMYTTGLDIRNKDIYIELWINPTDSGTWTNNAAVGELIISFNDDGSDYSLGGTGESSKIYKLSSGELASQGAFNKPTRIKINESSRISVGANLDETNVKLVLVGFKVNNAYAGFNHPICNLYELSVSDSTTLGWANSEIQFSQSDTRNNSSSLTAEYTSTVTAKEKNQLDVTIYEPTTAGYKGNLYYQTVDDIDGVVNSTKFLLAEVDKDDGVRKIGADYFTAWGSNSVTLSFQNIPMQSTFELESGYPDGTLEVNADWKTASTNGRQVYIGNIIQDKIKFPEVDFLAGETLPNISLEGGDTWADIGFAVNDIVTIRGSASDNGTFKMASISGDGALLQTVEGGSYTASYSPSQYISISHGTPETDKILKAPPGKLYGFSDKNFIDLELGAGNINVLETAGDRLLVFSDDNLTIVNVAQDYEYLEASMPGYGVANQRQVAKVSEGVAFVNSAGVFFFNGNTVDNISDNALDTLSWSNASSITYDPSEKLIMAWLDTTDDNVYCYSFKTKSWVTMLKNVMATNDTSPQTNSVNYQGDMYVVDTANALVKLSTDALTRDVILETGRISCGNLAMEKAFKDIWITTVNNTGTLNIAWSIDGGDYTADTPIVGSGRVKVPIRSKGKDMQFKITNTAADDEFEISDMQLIYRDKRVK